MDPPTAKPLRKKVLKKSERASFEKCIEDILSEFPSDQNIDEIKTEISPPMLSKRSASNIAKKTLSLPNISIKQSPRSQKDIVVNKTPSTIQIYDNTVFNQNSGREASKKFSDLDLLDIFDSLAESNDEQEKKVLNLPAPQTSTPNHSFETLPAEFMQKLQELTLQNDANKSIQSSPITHSKGKIIFL